MSDISLAVSLNIDGLQIQLQHGDDVIFVNNDYYFSKSGLVKILDNIKKDIDPNRLFNSAVSTESKDNVDVRTRNESKQNDKIETRIESEDDVKTETLIDCVQQAETHDNILNNLNISQEKLKTSDMFIFKPDYANPESYDDIIKDMNKLENIQDNIYNLNHDSIKQIKFPNTQYCVFNGVLTISGSFLYIGQIMDKINPCIKSVILNVLHFIKIDQSVVLPGINLIILSPRVDFADNIEINLSGQDCTKKYDLLQNEDGSDGLPGYPGSNSGSLFIYATKIDNIDNVVFKVNGGQGGIGTNGSNGRDGLDGKNASLTCYQYKDLSDLLTKSDKNGKFYNRIKTLYGFNGKMGGNGGKAGSGGLGGHPGTVQIYQSSNKIKYITGTTKNGKDGNPGKAGKGGKNGNNMKCYVWNIHAMQYSEISKVNTCAKSGKVPTTINSFNIIYPDPVCNIDNIVESAIEEYIEFLDGAKKYWEHNRVFGTVLKNFLIDIKHNYLACNE